jgi:hypothetical protein
MDSLFDLQENTVITARLSRIRNMWRNRINRPDSKTVFEYSGLSSQGLDPRKYFNEARIDAGHGVQEILRLVPAAAKLSRHDSDLLALVAYQTALVGTYAPEQVAAFARIEKADDKNLMQPLMLVLGEIVTIGDFVNGPDRSSIKELQIDARDVIKVLDAVIEQRGNKIANGLIDQPQALKDVFFASPSVRLTFSQLLEKYPTPEAATMPKPTASANRERMSDVAPDSSLMEYASPRGNIAENLIRKYSGGRVVMREGRLVEP